MVCGKCGQELEKGTRFCTKCGHNVKNAQLAFTKETGIIIATGIIIKLLVNFLVKGFYSFGNISLPDATILVIRKLIPIMNAIDPIINCVLFGLLAGIICQRFVLSKKENCILKNIAFVFLITFVSVYLIALIHILISDIIYVAYIKIQYPRADGHFRRFLFFIRGHFVYIPPRPDFFPIWLLNNLKGGLITSSICSLASFAYLKLRTSLSPDIA